MPTSTDAAGSLMLDKETDARFWAQTGYKPGQKLDMSNPTDRAMSKVWLDIHNKVEAENRAGRLVLTFNHPAVAQPLADAAVAHDTAAAHLDAAATAPDAATAAQHTDAAAQSAQLAQQKAQEAATAQPPTASPAVAQAAATEAHAKAQQPPPGVVVFPVGHPAHWHPNAKPSAAQLTQADTTPAPADQQPQDGDDHLALAQAANAPKMAGAAHQNGAHWTNSDYRAAADAAAFVLKQPAVIAYGKDGHPISAHPFASFDEASAAYDPLVSDPGDYWYIALYDPSRPAPGRVDETYLGGVQVEHEGKHVSRTIHDIHESLKAKPLSTAAKVAIGGLVIGSIAAIVFALHRTGGVVLRKDNYGVRRPQRPSNVRIDINEADRRWRKLLANTPTTRMRRAV